MLKMYVPLPSNTYKVRFSGTIVSETCHLAIISI